MTFHTNLILSDPTPLAYVSRSSLPPLNAPPKPSSYPNHRYSITQPTALHTSHTTHTPQLRSLVYVPLPAQWEPILSMSLVWPTDSQSPRDPRDTYLVVSPTTTHDAPLLRSLLFIGRRQLPRQGISGPGPRLER